MTATSTILRLTPSLTPYGRLAIVSQDDAPALEAALAERIKSAFERGTGHGLLRLGGAEIGETMPPVFAYWRDFGSRFVTALCTWPGEDEPADAQPAAPDDLATLAEAAPVMPGAEYLTAEVLRAMWAEMGAVFASERGQAKATREAFLKQLHPAWNVVGRVHFNLAENRTDEESPFAFLATYTHGLSQHGKAQHLPLGQALREFSCSCPDWASMCKHVAAVLYGIGARLDEKPELLFKLRKVDEKELIAHAGKGLPLSRKGPASNKVLAEDGLSELFGLEMGAPGDEPNPRAKAAGTAELAKSAARNTPIAVGKRSSAAKSKMVRKAAARKRKPSRR